MDRKNNVTQTNKKMKKKKNYKNNLKHALDPLVYGMGINGLGKEKSG